MFPSATGRAALARLAARALMTAALAAGLSAPAMAQAPGDGEVTKLGVLDCNISSGIGMIVGSSKAMTCRFRPSRGRPELYRGIVRRFGLDIGGTTRGRMAWVVFATKREMARSPGILGGEYVGASAEATVVAGVGANALIGGSERAIVLQPVSVQAQAGLNFAVGVAELILEPARSRATR